MSIMVQEADFEHVDGIKRVCTRGWRETYDGLIPDDEIEATLEEFYDPTRLNAEVLDPKGWDGWLVALEDDRVVGAGGGGLTEEGHGEVYVLYVDPDEQRRGIGTSLLRRMTEQQTAQGATWQYVSVAKGNELGLTFYEKHGFEVIGEHPSFGETLSCTSIRLRRAIGDD